MKDDRYWIKNIITYTLLITIIVLLITNNVRDNKPPENEADYCVEWGLVQRSDLIRECYDFNTLTPTCDWIIGDGWIFFFEYGNPNKIINNISCTRYVKSYYTSEVMNFVEGVIDE